VSAVGLELKARIAKLETENEKLREQLNPRSSLTQINIPAITRYIPRTVGEINQAEDAEAYTRAMKGI
jgi:cell shape-determining protein MreC